MRSIATRSETQDVACSVQGVAHTAQGVAHIVQISPFARMEPSKPLVSPTTPPMPHVHLTPLSSLSPPLLASTSVPPEPPVVVPLLLGILGEPMTDLVGVSLSSFDFETLFID
ncbi:unnamed protein product [Ilex paraguariensis]|uniref:Uncharacterized protein n=1 Tax=Ilex paraguariensis TaxID=185542 RepID=A0ABC8UYT3_9AQUA